MTSSITKIIRTWIGGAVCAAVVLVPGLGYGGMSPLEAEVKATYLYNFIQFVEWPQDAWAEGNEFELCVVGSDRLGAALEPFDGERVEGRSIRVHRLNTVDEVAVTRCKVVFLARRAGDSGQLLRQVPGRGVLTVGEAADFTKAGGMINLYEVRGRLHFSINDRAARRAGLIVSSRLLQLANKRL